MMNRCIWLLSLTCPMDSLSGERIRCAPLLGTLRSETYNLHIVTIGEPRKILVFYPSTPSVSIPSSLPFRLASGAALPPGVPLRISSGMPSAPPAPASWHILVIIGFATPSLCFYLSSNSSFAVVENFGQLENFSNHILNHYLVLFRSFILHIVFIGRVLENVPIFIKGFTFSSLLFRSLVLFSVHLSILNHFLDLLLR